MKQRRNRSIGIITLLLLFTFCNLNVFGQTTVTPLTATTQTIDGRTSSALNAYSLLDYDLLFGYSDYDATNAFIINGITVPLLNSGWVTDKGEHSSGNQNYVCGLAESVLYRNFFAVDLSNLSSYGITPPITSAVLHIRYYVAEPATGSTAYDLFDVSTSYSSINQNYAVNSTAGIDIYNDMGRGTVLGNVLVDRTAPSASYLNITFNSAGLSAINSGIGSTFVVGGKAAIVTVPIPYWAIVLTFLTIASILILRFRKRQVA